MKPINVILITIILVVSAVFLSFKGYDSWKYYEVTNINVFVEIDPLRSGIAGDTDGLRFGVIPPDGSSSKWIDLYNKYEGPVTIEIIVLGEMNGWISHNSPKEVLLPGQNRTVEFVVSPPEKTLPGNYSSIVKVKFRKVR